MTCSPRLRLPTLKRQFISAQISSNTLATIKSKNELIADVVALLQSPAKNVVSALQSAGGTIHGILETLSKKED